MAIPSRQVALVEVPPLLCDIPQTPMRSLVLNDMLKETKRYISESSLSSTNKAHVLSTASLTEPPRQNTQESPASVDGSAGLASIEHDPAFSRPLVCDVANFDTIKIASARGIEAKMNSLENKIRNGGENESCAGIPISFEGVWSGESTSEEDLRSLRRLLSLYHHTPYIERVRKMSLKITTQPNNDAQPSVKRHRSEGLSIRLQHHHETELGESEITDEETEGDDDDDGDYGFEDDGQVNHSSCAPFPHMWRSAVSHVLGSVTAAASLLELQFRGDETTVDRPPIVLFPAGGRHHAKSDRADGFCIFNDVVVCALFLKKEWRRMRTACRGVFTDGIHQRECRILIVDVDAHHGDGTEEAFRYDKNVTTLSIHVHGTGLFPGTGGKSSGNAVNVPLPPNAGDALFLERLAAGLESALEQGSPFTHCIVVAGTDTVRGDPHGHLSISVDGFVKAFELLVTELNEKRGLPLCVLGAGGYVDTTTSRCWSHMFVRSCSRRLPLLSDVPASLETFSMYLGVNFMMN